MSKSPTPFSKVRAQIGLSFASALAGWIAGLLLFAFITFTSGTLLGDTTVIESLFFIGLFLGFYIFSVWFLALLPLSLLVPRTSFFWKPGILGLIGIFAGPLIIGLWNLILLMDNAGNVPYQYSPYEFWQNFLALAFPACVISTATCLTGAFLNQRLLKQAS